MMEVTWSLGECIKAELWADTVQLLIYVKKLERKGKCRLFRTCANQSIMSKCFIHILHTRNVFKAAT